MKLPTQGTMSDCLGKHTVGLCDWNLDIISPCFDFIEDVFGLCETSNEDDLLWVEIKVKASKWKTNAIPTSTDQSTAVAVSVTPSSIFWIRGLKKLNISFLKAFMRIVRQPSAYQCGVLTWRFSIVRLELRVLYPYRLTHPV